MMTLNGWVDKNAPTLRDDIRTHLEVFLSDTEPLEEREQLLRLILISVRNWASERTPTPKEGEGRDE